MLQRTSIRAELTGSTGCSAAGQVGIGHAPVLALCRWLIAAGFNPKTPLEVYRGHILALRIRSIGTAAGLTVDESRTAFARWKAFPHAAGSPRIALFERPATPGVAP